MGLKILYNGQVTDFSDSKYDPQDYGSMRLNIRVGGEIKKYGLATSASQSSDKKVKFNINGGVYYIGTSSALSRQSDYTSYQTYYTYTHTSGEPKSSVLTREGTTTTATKTQPARYSYRASYYTGHTYGYTVKTQSQYYTRSAVLSSYRTVNYTAYWSGYSENWRGWRYGTEVKGRVSRTYMALQPMYSFTNVNLSSYSTVTEPTDPGAPLITANSTARLEGYHNSSLITVTTTVKTNIMYASFSGVGKTTIGPVNVFRIGAYYTVGEYTITTPITATSASTIYVNPPNYYAIQNWNGPHGVASGDIAVAANQYANNTVTNTQTGGLAINLSFWSRQNEYYTWQSGSASGPSGNSTLSSTATPISGVPAGWTISRGPEVTTSQQSYTYTDAGCTKTYQSNYSTSYWTVTHTLTSNQPTQSSVGSTKLTRVSHYTEHNFV